MTGTLDEDQYPLVIITRSFLLSMRNVSDGSCRENRDTHFTFNTFFFGSTLKSCCLWDNVKYFRAEQATDDNMAHAHCVLHA